MAKPTDTRQPNTEQPPRIDKTDETELPLDKLDEANNLQQSWRFDWEPPKAVLRDVRMIDWIFGRLRSSAQDSSN